MKKNLMILFYPKTEKENWIKHLPLPILKVGSELEGMGFEVAAIDERFEENYEDRLRGILDKAICFGVSSMTGYQIHGGLKASAFVKGIRKEMPVIWGGCHASILPENTLENLNIDIVVRGQGERTIVELADALKNQRGLKDIDGISYKENGRIISNKNREFQDLNTFHPARFDLFDFKRYIFKDWLGERTSYWNSSQGCPYQCGFCSMPLIYFRKWSGLKAETVLNDLKILANEYNVNGITFSDDNFFVDVKRIEKLCKGMVENKLKIRWAADVRVDRINRFSDEFMRLLKESGCSKLYVGAESGDQEVLDFMNKGIRVEDIYKAAEKVNEYGIISEIYIIVGFPMNPKKDLEKSLSLMRHVKLRYPDQTFTSFVYTPYPGTPLLKTAIENGLKIPEKLEEWADWSIQSVNTPWVNKKYVDTIDMFTKCFYPLAFPSASLKRKFRMKFMGFPYRMLHRLAKFRVKNDFFSFPFEWKLAKNFNKLKIKFDFLKKVESFR